MALKEFVYYADENIVGTLVGLIENETERDYVHLKIVPLNCIRPIVIKKPIHRSAIHTIHATSNQKGVEEKILFVYSGNESSLLYNALNSDNERIIQDLRETIRKLKVSVASHKQDSLDSRSGVNKTISAMKSVSKPSVSSSYDDFPERHYPRPMPPNNNDGYSDFDSF